MMHNNIPLTIIFILYFTFACFSQKSDSTNHLTQFSGAVTITNNGISLVPSFSLGKPATIFDFSIHKNRFSFEPQLRFAIEEAKPWSFVFWMRYKLIQTPKFKVGVGVHPSFVFTSTIINANGTAKDYITTKRYLAGEVAPNYFLTKNSSIGIYYLYAHGLADATKNTHLLGLNGNFSNIKLGNKLLMKIYSQVYYLKLDEQDGTYVTSTFTVSKPNFPLSISSVVNQKIDSNIPSNNFLWNVGLTYSY